MKIQGENMNNFSKLASFYTWLLNCDNLYKSLESINISKYHAVDEVITLNYIFTSFLRNRSKHYCDNLTR